MTMKFMRDAVRILLKKVELTLEDIARTASLLYGGEVMTEYRLVTDSPYRVCAYANRRWPTLAMGGLRFVTISVRFVMACIQILTLK